MQSSSLNQIAVKILFGEMANKIATSFLLAMTEMERMTEVEKIVTNSSGAITLSAAGRRKAQKSAFQKK